MNKFLTAILILFLCAFTGGSVFAQEYPDTDYNAEDVFEGSDDGFGAFGFGDMDDGVSGGGRFSFKMAGEINTALRLFINDFGSWDSFKEMELGDIVSGKLGFTVSGKITDAVFNVKIIPNFSLRSPILIDETYLRFYLGPVDIEAGIRKLTWGKADSFGPLDIINPVDYSDLSAIGDPLSIKMARPMLHVNWNIGKFSKLEGVFVPWFEGYKFASSGRWAPEQMAALPELIRQDLVDYISNESGLGATLQNIFLNRINEEFENLAYDPAAFYPDTGKLKYAQGGLRFSTSLGPLDLGVQYYFGRMPRPAFTVDLEGFKSLLTLAAILNPPGMDDIYFFVDFNTYHHIGIDYAQVIAGFNVRAELGANITGDLAGDDGNVYNPQIVWSFGFDRDLFWGINLNLQANGLVRLMHKKIGSDPLSDTEAGAKPSSTRITALLTKKFLQDRLEASATILWGIEDMDFLIIPGILWSMNDINVGLSMGFFGGRRSGELGQYRGNSYVKASAGWSF